MGDIVMLEATGRLAPERVDAILSVSDAHGVFVAAQVLSVTSSTVNRLRASTGRSVATAGHPSAVELERRNQRPDCNCHWCAGTRLERAQARIRAMHADGYAVTLIARLVHLPIETVRQAIARRNPTGHWIQP